MTGRTHGRKYAIRDDAFDVIDDCAAYWLGFIFADGSVSRTGAISVRLTGSDRAHLVTLREFLGADHPITDLAAETYDGYLCRPSCRLSVRSRDLGDRIRGMGKYEGPLAQELASSRHFWRGVVDGDGSIGFTNRGFPSFQLVGSQRLMDAFLTYLRAEGLAAKMTVRPSKMIFTVSTAGHTAASIVRLLYGDAGVALARKHVAAQAVIERELRDQATKQALWLDSVHRRQTARIFYIAGLSLEQVGRALGVSNVTVLRWLRETDTPRRPRQGGLASRGGGSSTGEAPRPRTWPLAGGLAG